MVTGCTLNDARLALADLATFHASWWQRDGLDRMSWLPLLTELSKISVTEAYPQNWKLCLEQFGNLLPPEIRDAAPFTRRAAPSPENRFEAAPHTIVHGDYRLDNFSLGIRAATTSLPSSIGRSPQEEVDLSCAANNSPVVDLRG